MGGGFGPSYGMSSYGSPYGSGYNALGGYGGGSYFGSNGSPFYSGFGSQYGGFQGHGYGGLGGGAGMPPGGVESSTMATFQMLESVVGAIGGFAQMLESTYMATHSSFFAMMGVAEQFANLRHAFGSLFGIFALFRFLRGLWERVTGRRRKNQGLNMTEFEQFKKSAGGPGKENRKRVSLMPLVLFLGAVFGGPYVLSKLIRAIAARQESQQQLPQIHPDRGASQELAMIDPSKLEFAKALYEFVPENETIELPLKRGDIIAIVGKESNSDGAGWWRGRLRDGRTGYFPSNYVEVIRRRGADAEKK
ncbi:peroxisomal membrane protein PEX13 [Dipodascopsis tothii]|uniref:peroxisomal membrane protein PEX13 n=1 Tax=Dipodascopsis tothii TaxID=44089 RepID=UPI0034CFB4F1